MPPVSAHPHSQPAPPVRVGVVGLGYWGRKLAQRYADLDGALLVGICDHHPSALARCRSNLPHATACSRLEDLLALRPELVVVATEPSAHVAVAGAALRAGCAVFVEKPVTTNVADLDHLRSLAGTEGGPILGSSLWSWDPNIDALAELAASGILGPILRVEGARQNLGCLKPGHDVIDDLLPHDLQILRRITGSAPDTVQAWGSRLAGTEALDTATIRLTWHSGPEAELRLSWVAPEKVRRMTLVGTRAMAVFDPLDASTPLRVLRVTPEDAARPEPAALRDIWVPPVATDAVEPLLAQCAETLACVRGAVPRLPLHAHREVAAVLEAARASVALGGQAVPLSGETGVPRGTMG